MEDSEGDCSVSLSSLLCREDESCLDDDEDKEDLLFLLNDSAALETEDEYIETLLLRENGIEINGDRCSDHCLNDKWLKCARSNAVRWILKMGASFGFDLHTVYLSVTYLDQFLLRREIDDRRSWAIWLLSIACLSLAAKMQECKVPALPEYRVDEYEFKSKAIQRMELLVLDTLEWRMCSITPFAYLNYFASKFSNESGLKSLLSRAVELILTTTEEINVMDHRPSVIAASAVLAAFNQSLTKKSMEILIGVISLYGSLESEHVFSCYNLMLELKKGKQKTQKKEILPDSQSTNTSSMEVLGVNSINSTGSKRKRLILNSYDRDCCLSDEK